MMVKVFQSNANGKIEFTRTELEKLLNEVYKKGYDNGACDTKQNYWTWTSPYISTTNLRTPSVTYATNTSTSIDNLRCDNVSTAANLEPTQSEANALETKKDSSYTISASSVAPGSISFNKSGDSFTISPTGYNIASALDEIISEFLKGRDPSSSKNLAPNGCIEASTPHAKLAEELKGL